MASRTLANPAFKHLEEMFKKETAGLTAMKRIRAITKFHMSISHKLWNLRNKEMRKAEKEMAADYRRMARAESDPAEKARLRRVAQIIEAKEFPESTLSA